MPDHRLDQLPPGTRLAARVAAALVVASLWSGHGLASGSGIPAVRAIGQSATASFQPLDILRERAERGDPSAQVRLGDAYADGDGVEVNAAEAAKWYSRAADRGDPDGQVKLAGLYRTGRGLELDRVAALRWLTIASALSPREREAGIRIDREALARTMTPEDAARAEGQAREWLERFAREKADAERASAAAATRAARLPPGVELPGPGVEPPRVTREVRPNYTRAAMNRGIEGTVWVEAVVMPDGSVGTARVSRSLDTEYGLDEEALKAARQWRFTPGTKDGVPVKVLVTIELTFQLRR